MLFMFRKSKKLGPLRVTASKRGLTVSGGTKRVRTSRSTTGRRTNTVNFGNGLRWTKSRRR